MNAIRKCGATEGLVLHAGAVSDIGEVSIRKSFEISVSLGWVYVLTMHMWYHSFVQKKLT